jgi:hypothetical protein
LKGELYFASIDAFDEARGSYKRAVWKTDGTESGTEKVTTFDGLYNFPSFLSDINILDAVGENIIIALQIRYTPIRRFELWKTDGTEAGAERLASLFFNNIHSLNDMISKDGVFYMIGTRLGPPYGRTQLWRTDGTPCGTYVMLEGAWDLTLSSGNIFLSASTPLVGMELFILHPEENVPCADTPAGRVASTEATHNDIPETRMQSYPNPFTHEFTFKTEGTEDRSVEIKVMDQYGNTVQIIRHVTLNNEYNLGKEWPPGIYYLHVNVGSDVLSGRIVKTK